jgi:2-dehydropantoate 2-reductase
MRVCVYGAGSIGCVLGGLLSPGNDVTLVGREWNMSAVRGNGLVMTGQLEGVFRPRAVESIEGIPAPDLLILTTKSYDTDRAISACRSFISDETLVLTLQNGLGNLERIRRWVGDRAFGGTTTLGAQLFAPGRVLLSGLGWTVIGSDTDPSGADGISAALGAAGMPSSTSSNVYGEIWSKTIVNSSINPVTAILGIPNGAILESETISSLAVSVADEGERVATALGVDVPHRPCSARVKAVAAETAGNRSSMLRDLELGRRTEIAQINGAICTTGAKLGVPTPLNRALSAMVEALESHRRGERLIS